MSIQSGKTHQNIRFPIKLLQNIICGTLISVNNYNYIFQYEFAQCVVKMTNDSNTTMPLTNLILGENFTSFTFLNLNDEGT